MMEDLISRAEAEVVIEYRQFHLREIEHVEPSVPVKPDPESWLSFRDSQLYFQSAANDHYAHVVLEYWNSAPEPTQDPGSEVNSELDLLCPGSSLEVWTITSGPTSLRADIQPGLYRLRTQSRGRETTRRALLVPDLSDGLPKSDEFYLLQIWRTGHGDET